jgi:hypothetical protein
MQIQQQYNWHKIIFISFKQMPFQTKQYHYRRGINRQLSPKNVSGLYSWGGTQLKSLTRSLLKNKIKPI